MSLNCVESTDSSSHAFPASPCSCRLPEPSRLIMDTDGDLSLKVGDTKCVTFSLNGCDSDHCDPDSDHEHELPVIYIVCSKTLSRASPVWKALLYGGFAESKPLYASSASDWVVELPDDNPKAMATILNIIHSRFESTPRATEPIDLEDLYQLAVLTDKYDLTATLRPWVSAWMEYAREEYEQLKRQEADFLVSHLERLSWISWEMGDAYLYEKVSQDLAHRCSVDVNGHLQYEIGDEMVPLFNSTLEPPGHRDELKVIRLNYIKNALAIYEDAVAQLFKPPRSLLPATICKDPLERWKCEPAILGTMIRSLAWSGYWPLPAASDVRGDFNGMCRVLSAIYIGSPTHAFCAGIHMRDEKLRECRDRSPHISSERKARMDKQAAISGCQYSLY